MLKVEEEQEEKILETLKRQAAQEIDDSPLNRLYDLVLCWCLC